MSREKATGNLPAKYDPDLAERAVANIDPVYRGGDGGLGNRAATRAADNRAEYELFRPIQNIPRKQRDIIEACMNVYHRVGLLRNVVDMMSSFGCQGIQVVHPIKSRERLYKHWFSKVRGPERSERFLNGLYRAGNVIVKRQMAKLSAGDLRDLQRGFASLDPDAEYKKLVKPRRNDIPIEYTFLNPATIEMMGGELATFLGNPVYVLRVPRSIMQSVKTPKSPTEKQLVADLPSFIREPLQAGEPYVRLDNDKLAVYHYMKDDWQQWALPVTYSILADLILYEKMKLADMAALEGAISHIRIWKLGDLKEHIQPGPAMYQKLHDMLLSNVGGGAMDLIWDAAIDLIETKTDVANFLGAAKYEPVLKSIFAGLGIPQSLSGGSGQGAGFTNSAISLKTLIERLTYGRDQLTDFWNNELRILQEAFGDTQPARIIFDNMSLYDEAAEKMLWFQMYDRHLCDDATMQEKFGLIPDVVAMRIKREEKQRDSGKKPPKATPFHDPQADHELTKIALQQGTLAPTEAGVEKKPKKPNDISTLDFQAQQAQKDRNLQKQQQDAQIEMNKQKMAQDSKQNQEVHKQQLQHNDDKHQLDLKHKDQEHKAILPIKVQTMKKRLQNQKKGVPGQGRPKNSKDTTHRKQRVPKLSTKAFILQQWARETLKAIATATTKNYVKSLGKSSARALTTEEVEGLERSKFALLCAMEPFDNSIPPGDFSLPLPQDVEDIYRGLVVDWVENTGNQPTIDYQRDMQASAYTLWQIDNS